MAIEESGVSAISVGDLIKQELRIPHYQRPYVWEPATASQLLYDIRDALDGSPDQHGEAGRPYALGAVILHSNGDQFDVVDGQQRLLTLRMILAILESERIIESRAAAEDNPVSLVWHSLKRDLDRLSEMGRGTLAKYIRDECLLVRIVTNDVDEAFRVFDSQNYRGKPLAPHDLLKAHHLREMREESDAQKAAIVEDWEVAGDSDLDELFSIYLYRISRWSRGESAPGFSTRDIGIFKGITPKNAVSPSARYHLAAQKLLPMLNELDPHPKAGDERKVQHSRFQLDAPILAGRPFFEMVTFMLEEIKHLQAQTFPTRSHSIDDGSDELADDLAETFATRLSRSRYRKVTELYLAAMLYYVNKFADEDLAAAQDRLFIWAYDLRIKLLRVQQASINNLAWGKDQSSAFVVLRNASTGRAVRQLRSQNKQYGEGHEQELLELLREKGA